METENMNEIVIARASYQINTSKEMLVCKIISVKNNYNHIRYYKYCLKNLGTVGKIRSLNKIK